MITHKPQESLSDWRDRLIDEGKIETCKYMTDYGRCKRRTIRGKICYYHKKRLEGLL